MKRKSIALLLSLVMCVSTITACSGSKSSETQAPIQTSETQEVSSKHLNVGWHSELKTIDPIESSWEAARLGISETLTRISPDLELIPWLAESWEQVDNLTWKFNIREGVFFSNGKVCDAVAVKAALDRSVENYSRATSLLNIKEIIADGQILTIITNEINAALPNNLADHCANIFDVDTMGEDSIPVGTGPFAITSWNRESKMELTANKSYWGGIPKLDAVTVTVIPDGNAQAMALDNGEVDLCFQLPTENVLQFADNDQFVITKLAGSRSQMVYFNLNNEFLSDINVRKAITMAIDRDALANVINKGNSEAATAIFPASFSFGKVPGVSYDLEGAKKLLADSGYTDTDGDGLLEKDGKLMSFRFITYGSHGALLPTFAEAMQSSLKEIGIAVDITLHEYSAYSDLLKADNFDLAMGSNIMAPTVDPQYFADILFYTDADYNYGHYSNAEVDALVEKLDSEFDPDQRVALTLDMQKIIVEDCPWMTLGHLKYQVVSNVKVSGYETQPTELYLLTADTEIK